MTILACCFLLPLTPAVDGSQLTLEDQPAEVAASVAADEALRMTLEPVEIHRMPLAMFLAHLQRVAAVNLVVRWQELNRIGVYSDSRVTLTLHEATVGEALRHGLRLADRDGQGAAFAIREGVIVVSSLQDLAAEMEVRVYDVTSLISAPLSDTEQRELQEAVAALWKQHYHVFSPPWHRQPRTWAREGRSRSLRDRSLTPRERETRDILAQMQELATARRTSTLIRVIQQSIDPPSWTANGGEALFEALDGKLVIRQSPDNHQRVAALLESLRSGPGEADAPRPVANP